MVKKILDTRICDSYYRGRSLGKKAGCYIYFIKEDRGSRKQRKDMTGEQEELIYNLFIKPMEGKLRSLNKQRKSPFEGIGYKVGYYGGLFEYYKEILINIYSRQKSQSRQEKITH